MASSKYDFRKIEKKWQKAWERSGIYKAKGRGKKWYSLIEFPYPSGDGLHVGHVRSNTAMDIISRKRRMEGYDVLYPIGWDAFGLPTENYAIKTGVDPAVATKKNTDTFRRQLKALGFSFDWSREINTTDPEYYKWTQWMFLEFFKRGLAYKSEVPINWCPKDKIGLANEEAAGGVCDRCGGPVEKRMKSQWMIRITAYADKLLEGLKDVDYITRAKVQQENWIGRSEGAEIDFPLNWPTPKMELVFATNNESKVKRMRKLFAAAGLRITLKTLREAGIKEFDVKEDGTTLAENAEKKARAIAALTDLPVFADDSGLFIEGTEINSVTVKRNALKGVDEKSITPQEVRRRVEKYYQNIAASRGGKVDAEWRNALCFVTPEKVAVHVETVRPIVLTDTPRGTPDPYFPLRTLYISKATGKYALEQNEEEERRELQPITDGLKKLFTPAIKVFTTRPDTLFGATYMVLAPEHPFVQACIKRKALGNSDEVARYLKAAGEKTEFERTGDKGKTGVELKGVKAVNPANKEELPIFVADYVLGSYGTGAIMAVPAHDERDFEFATRYGLPVREVVAPLFISTWQDAWKSDEPETKRLTAVCLVKHWLENKYLFLRKKSGADAGEGAIVGVAGGVDEGEDIVTAGAREIEEETGYKNAVFKKKLGSPVYYRYYSMNGKQNRIAELTPLYYELQDGAREEVSTREKTLHENLWLAEDEIAAYTGSRPFNRIFWDRLKGDGKAFLEPGWLMNSGKFSSMDSEAAKWEITKFVGGERKVQYKLRDWVFSRQRYWGEPIPLVFCPACKKREENPKSEIRNPKSGAGWIPIPEKDLPVKLPKVKKYQPRDDGESPLASVEKWVNTKCPRCKGPAKRETDTMPNWAGSSWYFLRYCDPKNKKKFADPKKLHYWMGVDWYNGGMEHTVLHLLYSRFWNRFLYDIGAVPVAEPYKKRTSHGLILAAGGEKMSKSKGNVLNPDDIVAKFGADSLRLYEMFMGPFDQAIAWDMRGILGVHRFLERVWRLGQMAKSAETSIRAVHRAIRKVSSDIETMSFNTAVSALMICANELEGAPLGKKEFGEFLKILSPFAPHLAQELWARLGKKTFLDKERWPAFDPELVKEATFELVIQVNGRVRDSVEAPAGISEGDALALALGREKVKAFTYGAKPKKVVFVPGRLVSIVV